MVPPANNGCSITDWHVACSNWMLPTKCFKPGERKMKKHTAPKAGKAEKKAARKSAGGKARVTRDNTMSRDEQRQQTIHRQGHPK
jgi:hypothetical protein